MTSRTQALQKLQEYAKTIQDTEYDAPYPDEKVAYDEQLAVLEEGLRAQVEAEGDAIAKVDLSQNCSSMHVARLTVTTAQSQHWY